MRALLLAAFACLVDLSCAALFQVDANSTCDPSPLYIEGLQVDSVDCIGGVAHSASALLDENQNTFWQSAMGVSNVALNFSSLTSPLPVRAVAITLYWFSEPPKLVTVEQWNGQSFEPALVCNVTAGCLEPRSGGSCIPCDVVGMEQTLNFTAPGIAAPWNIVFTGFQVSSNYYALDAVVLSMTCDEGAHLTETGCVYNSSCNGCETRLLQAASVVNFGAANLTTAIELIGNLSSATEGFGALDAAIAEGAAIWPTIKNALDSLYLNVSLVGVDVEASSNVVVAFISNLNSLIWGLENFHVPNATAVVTLVVSLKGRVDSFYVSTKGMCKTVAWAAGNASIWEDSTRATIDRINATALLFAGWNCGNATAESPNEANAKQIWHDANETLRVVAGQEDIAMYLNAIVDEASYKLEQVSNLVDQLTSLVFPLDRDAAYLSQWRDNVSRTVEALNSSIASLRVDLAAANGVINRSAFTLSSARELLNASELLVMESIPQALDSLNATVSSAEAQSAQCSHIVENALNHTLSLQLQGAQIKRLLSASISVSATSSETYQRYESANQTLLQAESDILRASGLLSGVRTELQLHSLNRTLERAKWAINAANYTRYGAASVNRTCQELSTSFSEFQTLLNVSVEQVSVMENFLDSVSVQLELLQGKANTTVQRVASVMGVANKATTDITSINLNISTIAGNLLSNVTNSLAFLDSANKLNSNTSMLLDAAHGNLTLASNTFNHTQSVFSNISHQAAINDQKLDSLNSSVSSLMQQLQEAIKAAARIDLALHLYGSSSLQYKLPNVPTSKSLQLSLHLRPDNTTGSLLYLGDTGRDYVELRLDEGNVVFESNAFELVAGNGSVQVGEWYQIYASEDGTGSWLSVAPLQGGRGYTNSDNTTIQLDSISYNDSAQIGGGQGLGGAYSGCIDHVIINSVRLPLLVPDTLPANVSTCAPRPPEEKRALDNSSWFQGVGSYAKFQLLALSDNTSLSVRLQFRSAQPDGLLYAQEKVALYLSGGRVALKWCATVSECSQLVTTQTYNSGEWCSVEVTVEVTGEALLSVNGTEELAGGISSLQELASTIYLGGTPVSTYGVVQNYPSFAGCMMGFVLDTVPMSIRDAAESNRVYPSSCPSELGSGARFMGSPGGALFNISSTTIKSVEFYFRSTQIMASLFHSSQLSISLYHGTLRLDYPTGAMVTGQWGLNDNQWHSVFLNLTNGPITMVVDGRLPVYLEGSTENLGSRGPLSIGGINTGYSGPAANGFRGCIANLSVNEGVVDFFSAMLDGVALYACSGPRPSVAPPSSSSAVVPSPSEVFSVGPTSVGVFSTEVPRPTSVEVFSTEVPRPTSVEEVFSTEVPRPTSVEEVFSTEIPQSTSFSVEIHPSSSQLSPGSTSTEDLVSSSSPVLASSLDLTSLSILFTASSVITVISTSSPAMTAVTSTSSPAMTTIISTSSPPITPSPTCAPPAPLSCTPPSTVVGTNGNLGSFLSFNISAPAVLNSFNITLTFRTATSNAVLLYSLGRIYPDYLALELHQGRLVFSYQLGSGPARLQSSKMYNDNANHTVALWRNRQNGTMMVDGEAVATGTSPGTYTQLNLDGTLLFLGGIPLNVPVIGLLQSGAVPLSSLACFNTLSLNGGYYDLLSHRVASNGIEQCRVSYVSAAMFNGSGYANMLSSYGVGVNFNLSISLKTTNCSGLLAYVASAAVSDFLALELYNGNVRFMFNNGGGPVSVVYSPSNASELCNGQWHTLAVAKSGVSGTITVDNSRVTKATGLSSSYVSVNTMDPLYIGGVPKNTVLRSYVLSKTSFYGCIDSFRVTNGLGTLVEVPFSQAVQTVGVSLHSCGL